MPRFPRKKLWRRMVLSSGTGTIGWARDACVLDEDCVRTSSVTQSCRKPDLMRAAEQTNYVQMAPPERSNCTQCMKFTHSRGSLGWASLAHAYLEKRSLPRHLLCFSYHTFALFSCANFTAAGAFTVSFCPLQLCSPFVLPNSFSPP